MDARALVDDLRRSVQAAADVPWELAATEQQADLLTTAAAARALLDGVLARGLSAFAEAGGPEEAGAPNVKAWARRDLRLDASEAGRLLTAGRTMRALPRVAESLYAGRIRLAHVHEFSAGLKKTDPLVVTAAEDYLLDVAERSEPAALRAEIREFVEAIHPDELDAAYIRGMDRRDIQVSKVGEGYAVTGFLDIATGSKLKAVVDHLGAPDDRHDTRSPSQRRVGNLDRLLTHVLEHGLPTRKGFRPQIHVTVDLERLQGDLSAAPGRLHGWGAIPDLLLGELLCDADITPVLTDGQELATGDLHAARRTADVLNVGRTERLATQRQRIAVKHRQHDVCANPGCHNTHLEMHHIDWWARDFGRTDLADLLGLCPRCHHLLHAGLLEVSREPTTGEVVITTQRGRRLTASDERERGFRRLLAKRRLREIRRMVHDQAERERAASAA
ncbi:HNH endonuclease signature motif containing protein [Mumia sp. Pv 4-285]|uniref:HNH endonuclease signature motif containing protein n=1 Tax=Mumia qirimensis TaxID=3234852 RepID=UPI00351CED32